MSGKKSDIPIWFFIGLLLLVYGLLCLGEGVAQMAHPPATTLANLHATFWGGVVLTLLGGGFVIVFRPSSAAGD